MAEYLRFRRPSVVREGAKLKSQYSESKTLSAELTLSFFSRTVNGNPALRSWIDAFKPPERYN